MRCQQFQPANSRRQMLAASAAGFGHVAFSAMAAAGDSRLPHLQPHAKRIIFLFMWGGPSHVDLFDPKPQLNARDGEELSGKSVGNAKKSTLGKLLGSPFQFRQHGDSGVWMSELLPNLSRHADKMCVVRSLHTEGNAHGEALLNLHTGTASLLRPSVGAWVSYGLGSESQDIPSFVTISPPRGHGGVQNYGSAFLPSVHQGTAIGSAETPVKDADVSNLVNQRTPRTLQKRQLDLIQRINRRHLQRTVTDPRIEGLIDSYELAFRMQSTMPHVMSLQNETKDTLELYGIDSDPTDNFGRQCLLARRFAEAGARYIQVSTDYTWDHHQKVKEGCISECAKTDLPIAGLLEDLDRRGLLEDTLVVWGGEFGRTPMAENGHGRNHHPTVGTVWLAGGGACGGLTWGATDEFGYGPVENPVLMHDLHATMLYALGLDHERLTFRHAGRNFRLTDVYGDVKREILS